ncbi:MAG: aminotransferase class V-fold PLP-dependent enzyme [Armatimonadaceae bacterium]
MRMMMVLDNEVGAFRAQVGAFSMLQVNAGTKGICHPKTTAALLDWTRRVEDGGYEGYVAAQEAALTARDRLAAFCNAKVTELAFTGNATVSLNIAMDLPWHRWNAPVDVLISDHEYPATNMVFGYLQQRGKIRIVRYGLSTDTETLIANLERARTPNTKVMVLSHVCCNTGKRTDAAAASAWAREHGVMSYIDGAQALGQVPVDLDAMGCDLYITNGHKWLGGPNGVGLLYVRDGFENEMWPVHVGHGMMPFTPDNEYLGEPVFAPGAHRFELMATRPAQTFATMNTALDVIQELGLENIRKRQELLSDHIKQRVLEQPDRFELISPLSFDVSSALVSIRIKGVSGAEINAFAGKVLAEKRAFLRPVPEFDALRISAAYYNVPDDYERLWALLSDLKD